MDSNESIADTLAAKSDQLNSDDLIAGPITVTITGWKRGETKQQPVSLSIGPDHQPYIPCLSMRRVLVAEWGDRPAGWVGRSLTLYRDPAVMFGGVQVGGIRISHMSDMKSETSRHSLTTARAKKTPFTVKRLEQTKPSYPKQQPASEISDKQIAELRARLAKHIPSDGDRKTYVLETLGVKGNPTLGASWTREQYATATMFCDEMEGPV